MQLKLHSNRLLILLAILLLSGSCSSKKRGLNGAYLEQVQTVRILHLYGSDHQQGYAHGYLMAEEILDLAQRFMLDYVLQVMTTMDYASVCNLVENNATWPDSTMEMFRGILEGIQDKLPAAQRTLNIPGEGIREIELVDIMAGAVVGDWSRVSGCSGFMAWGQATGGPTIHARNMDYHTGNGVLLEHSLVISRNPEVGVNWVSLGHAGSFGCGTCMNQYGLTMEGNNGGVGMASSQTTGIIGRPVLAAMAMRHLGDSNTPIQDALGLYRSHRIYVSQNVLFARPFTSGLTDDQVAAVFESDGNDFEEGSTLRSPSELSYSAVDRTDVILATNHFLKRVPAPASGDSTVRYDELWRRIQVALDSAHPENPTADNVIDVTDAIWIMQGVERPGTILFNVFEPNQRRVHVAFQPADSPGTPASQVAPTTLEWSALFPR